MGKTIILTVALSLVLVLAVIAYQPILAELGPPSVTLDKNNKGNDKGLRVFDPDGIKFLTLWGKSGDTWIVEKDNDYEKFCATNPKWTGEGATDKLKDRNTYKFNGFAGAHFIHDHFLRIIDCSNEMNVYWFSINNKDITALPNDALPTAADLPDPRKGPSAP